MVNESALRGRIFSRYRNISEFGNRIGWNHQKVFRILSGKQSPTADEIGVMSNALDINDADTLVSVFFADRVHKVD